MKHIMDSSSHRQQQPVRNIAHALQHLKRPEELRSKLATPRYLERSNRAVQQTKPNPLAR
jgi:hypothetical protein